MFKLIDWTGNELTDIRFNSFESGWEYIYENFEDTDDQYDDLFIVKVEGD